MRSGAVRTALAHLFERRLARGSRHLSADELAASALVFAPHPDDECLGCGGTILRKTGVQAEVAVVFVSDGAASHASLIEPDRLRSLRVEEARTAAARLGVRAENVVFLGHPDGCLSHTRARAVAEIEALLEDRRPAQVFVPHADEPPADHRSVRASVLKATSALPTAVQVLEYPIWWWLHWPWVRLSFRRTDLALELWRRTLKTAFGFKAARAFNTWVDVADVLERKRVALEAHASQMSRPNDRADWPILRDVAAGDFLARLLGAREFFTTYLSSDPGVEP
jgi:LmbE family N-acetylglucosaminyl deacetylase